MPALRSTYSFVWVKGHAGNEENECCDQLATQALAASSTLPTTKILNPAAQP